MRPRRQAVGAGAAHRSIARAGAVLALIVGLIAATGGVALADGDPASDYLLGNQVFLTSQSGTVSPAQRQLLATVSAANRAGFTIRVAVISSDYDLGSVTELWRKPRTYARFLGLELSLAYTQRLLVVMPNGFGFNWPGHAAAPAYRLLATVAVQGQRDGLAASAQAAVRRLATAAGIVLPPSQAAASTGSVRQGSVGTLPIVAGVAAALAAFLVFALGVRRARRGRPGARRERRPAIMRPGVRVGLRWAVPGVTVLAAVAIAGPLLASGRAPRSDAQVSVMSVVTPPAFSWPAGQRAAPNFSLRDQDGRAVSVLANRGRPVIVTFIDPLCRNLCPLEAQVLNQLEGQVPIAQRPVILAVSVDVYANARPYLLQDVREWHLAPQWRWAVGRPASLADVWNRYKIGVKVSTRRIAGTITYRIAHTEAAYLLDATGHERALFLWPFYPQDIERVLRQLA